MASMSQKQVRQILGDLERQGSTVETGRRGGSSRVIFPNGTVFNVHSSPSDTNWHHQLRRATVKAGLVWPEDRKLLKTTLREKAGRMSNPTFVTEYGGHMSGPVSQEAQDRIAQLITGKSETRVPAIKGSTGMSEPTITKALIRLGWLQHQERRSEFVEGADGKKTGTVRAYWSPAPDSVLETVSFRGKNVHLAKREDGRFATMAVAPTVSVTIPAEEESVSSVAADLEAIAEDMRQFGDTAALEEAFGPITTVAVPERNENEWFAEAERLESRAIAAEQHVDRLNAQHADDLREIDRLTGILSNSPQPDDSSNSWKADLTLLPDFLTVSDLIANARVMGIEATVTLRRIA